MLPISYGPLTFNGGTAGGLKFKGSLTFEELPTTGQEEGDMYNITNDFTLGGKHYVAGTNVAWTGTEWDALGGSVANVLIQANSNTTVNGHQVPSLTSSQITQAYNGIVAGKSVVITDASGLMHFAVDQADTISDEIYITFNYFNIMILDYIGDGTIEFKEIVSKQYVDDAIGTAIESSY